MTKLVYLAAMALLGLGLTMAQSSAPVSDPSNSSKSNQTQNGSTASKSGQAATHNRKDSQQPQEKVPDPTVQDHQNSTNSTTGASGESNSAPPTSKMGTTGSSPEPENTPPANRTGDQPAGDSTDQQPNSSSPPSSPHLAMSSTPAARALATHSPDPGTCMNPASLDSTQMNGVNTPPRNPDCD